MAADLLVFTANFPVPPTDISLLRRSCELYNIELATYGDGSWPSYGKGKVIDAAAYLETHDEPFALFLDGRDTFVTDNAANILDAYQRIGSEILIAGERTCWPDATLGTHYPYPHNSKFYGMSPWRFINSGGWIGVRRTLIQALKAAAEYAGSWPNDDQRMWTEIFLYGGWRHRIEIDSDCAMFQCMGGTHGHELGPTGENLVTRQKPKCFHFNGRTPGMGDWYRALTGDLGYKGI